MTLVDTDGSTTETSYDENGNTTKILTINTDGTTKVSTYDSGGTSTSVTETASDGTVTTYDSTGEYKIKSEKTSSNGSTQTTTYDESGNVVSIENKDSSGNVTQGNYTIEMILQLKYPQLSSTDIARISEKIIANSYSISSNTMISYNPLSNKSGIDNVISKYIDEEGNIIEE